MSREVANREGAHESRPPHAAPAMSIARSDRGPANLFRFAPGDTLLRQIMDTAAIGLVLVGMDGRLSYANRAFAALAGHGDTPPLGAPLDTLFDARDADAPRHLARLLRGETEGYRGEHRLRHRGGAAVWVLVSASVLRSEKSGRPLHLVLQIVDIDGRKRAEAALAASESRWAFALEGGRQGVWEHDIRTDTMFYSRMWRLMRGFGPDEEIDGAQEVWLARLHPDDRERIRAVVGKQDRGEDGYDTLEYRERHRDGHYVWILSRGRPVEWDEHGNAVRTIGTDTDISRLKEVEAQLAAEKEWLRVTLASIGDGVISTDAGRRISFINPAAARMTGWSAADATGRPLDEVLSLVAEDTGAEVDDPVATCLAAGATRELDADVALVSRHGRRRAVRCAAAPVRAPGGGMIGTVLVLQDVTSARALQKELAHSATHDALTGLPNRTGYEAALDAAAREAIAEDRVHALCFIDLDRFKPVNDTAGHAAGDALLRLVAETIRGCCRASDFAARVGGDEFAVLLADCTLPHARAVAEKIAAAIADIDFAWAGAHFRIGASIGVTAITRESSQLGFTGEADAACYVAKARGRGGVAVFGEAADLAG